MHPEELKSFRVPDEYSNGFPAWTTSSCSFGHKDRKYGEPRQMHPAELHRSTTEPTMPVGHGWRQRSISPLFSAVNSTSDSMTHSVVAEHAVVTRSSASGELQGYQASRPRLSFHPEPVERPSLPHRPSCIGSLKEVKEAASHPQVAVPPQVAATPQVEIPPQVEVPFQVEVTPQIAVPDTTATDDEEYVYIDISTLSPFMIIRLKALAELCHIPDYDEPAVSTFILFLWITKLSPAAHLLWSNPIPTQLPDKVQFFAKEICAN